MKLLLFSLFFASCGYHFQNKNEQPTLSVPYAKGDNEGMLTAAIVKEVSTTGGYDYVKSGGDYTLKVIVVGDGQETIGYRYDRNEFSGELQHNLKPTENRRKITAQISLVDNATDQVVIGPLHITSSTDFDYVDINSIASLATVTPSGRKETVMELSLGQLDSIEGAQDDAIAPIYHDLAQKISDAIRAVQP